MNRTDKRKTASYCRTALADIGKIAAHEAQLRAYADEHGYGSIVCYRDCGAAGNTLDRPAMNRLVADIKAGEIGEVLALDISRIARTFPLSTEWRKLLNEHGVAFVTLADGEQSAAMPGLTYRLVGDYLLPNIALTPEPAEEKYKPLGRFVCAGRSSKSIVPLSIADCYCRNNCFRTSAMLTKSAMNGGAMRFPKASSSKKSSANNRSKYGLVISNGSKMEPVSARLRRAADSVGLRTPQSTFCAD
jgi:hypothetical protein